MFNDAQVDVIWIYVLQKNDSREIWIDELSFIFFYLVQSGMTEQKKVNCKVKNLLVDITFYSLSK